MEKEFIRILEKYTMGTASPEEIARLNEVYAQFQNSEEWSVAEENISPRRRRGQFMLPVRRSIGYKEKVQRSLLGGIGKKHLIASSLVVVVLVFVASRLFWRENTSSSEAWINVVADKGEQKFLILPDGTSVYLNSNSSISYPSRFENNKRLVALSGEAFFDVEKDESAPMLINTDKMEIHVLGTTLNVRAYPDDIKSETTLLTGSVKIVSKASPENVVYLKPKHKYTEFHEDRKGKVKVETSTVHTVSEVMVVTPPAVMDEHEKVSPDHFMETEWMRRSLTLRSETLENIAIELERRYDVHIQFENLKVAKQKYSARFENEDLDTLLKALQLVAPFNYRKEADGRIIIY